MNILLTIDGGLNFDHILLPGTENDGIETVIIPNKITNLARIKVEAANNIFFNISRPNFKFHYNGFMVRQI